MFGRVPSRADDAPAGLTLSEIEHLHHIQVRLPGTVDSSPILMTGITIHGAPRDLLVVTTSYGITLAIDAHTGRIWWRYVPSGLARWSGSTHIQVTSPVADPDRRHVYVTTPDGYVRKLAIATGDEVRTGAWPARITEVPAQEKLDASLNISGCFVVASTSSYFDNPPYVGHVVTINRTSGRIAHVFNTLCSDRPTILVPSTCRLDGGDDWGASVWAHGAPSIDPATGDLLLATGNGNFNGRTDWGDSVLALSPDASRLLQNFTPANQAVLNAADLDLGSSAPAILPVMGAWHLAVQAGKDRVLRLIDLRNMNGHGDAGPSVGGELASIAVPDELFGQPAAYRDTAGALILVPTHTNLTAYQVWVSGRPRIRVAWQRSPGANSVVIAGGFIYAYDAWGGGLRVYTLRTGHLVATLPVGLGHWNSPIVAAGVVALPEGDADRYLTSGVLDIYH